MLELSTNSQTWARWSVQKALTMSINQTNSNFVLFVGSCNIFFNHGQLHYVSTIYHEHARMLDHGRANWHNSGIFKRTPHDFTQRSSRGKVRCGTWLWWLGQLEILLYSPSNFVLIWLLLDGQSFPLIALIPLRAKRTPPPFLYRIVSEAGGTQ